MRLDRLDVHTSAVVELHEITRQVLVSVPPVASGEE